MKHFQKTEKVFNRTRQEAEEKSQENGKFRRKLEDRSKIEKEIKTTLDSSIQDRLKKIETKKTG